MLLFKPRKSLSIANMFYEVNFRYRGRDEGHDQYRTVPQSSITVVIHERAWNCDSF